MASRRSFNIRRGLNPPSNNRNPAGSDSAAEAARKAAEAEAKKKREAEAKKRLAEIRKENALRLELEAAGFRKAAQQYQEEYKARKRAIEALAIAQKELEEELINMQEDALRDQHKAKIDALEVEARKALKLQEKADKAARAMIEKRQKAIEAMEERAARSKEERWKSNAEGASDLISKLTTLKNLDAKTGLEGFAKGLTDFAERSSMAATAMGAEAGALAGVAAELALVLGPVAAMVGVLGEAYGQTKELNKAIIASNSGFDLVGGGTDALAGRLGDLRRVVTGVALDMRMTNEEVTSAISAMSDAGMTYKEFSSMVEGAGTSQQKYEDVIRSSITASQGLGVEVSTIAEMTNKMTRDMGYGLNDIQGAFGLIATEAGKAGMRTKDFFSAINEASSGMAMYNFSVSDTVELFGSLVKVLGEDAAKAELNMTKRFRNMGYQERMKTAFAGGGAMANVAKVSANRQGDTYSKKYAGTEVGKALEASGLMANGKVNMRALTRMSAEELTKKLATKGISDVAAGEMRNLRRSSAAYRGGPDGVAASFSGQDKLAELATVFTEGSAYLGKTSMADATGPMRMAVEQATGLSGEQYDQMADLQQSFMTKFEALKKENPDKVKGMDYRAALAAGFLTTPDDMERIAQQGWSLTEKMSNEQLKETRSIGQTMENVIAVLLGRIGDGIDTIAGIISVFDYGNRNAQRMESVKKQDAIVSDIEALSNTLMSKKNSLLSAKTETEKSALQTEIDNLQAEVTRKREDLKTERDTSRAVSRGERDTGYAAEAVDILSGKTGQNATLDALSLLDSKTGGNLGLANEGIHDPEVKKKEEDRKRQKQEQVNQKLRDEKLQETDKKGFEEMVKTLSNLDQREAIQQMISYLGITQDVYEKAISGTDKEKATALDTIRTALDADGRTEAESLLLARTGLNLNPTMEPPKEDFIYRGGGGRGEIHPIDKMDEFFGVKPGGAVNQAVSQGGAGGTVINNYINGNDEPRMYAILKKVLLDTGYTDMRKY